MSEQSAKAIGYFLPSVMMHGITPSMPYFEASQANFTNMSYNVLNTVYAASIFFAFVKACSYSLVHCHTLPIYNKVLKTQTLMARFGRNPFNFFLTVICSVALKHSPLLKFLLLTYCFYLFIRFIWLPISHKVLWAEYNKIMKICHKAT